MTLTLPSSCLVHGTKGQGLVCLKSHPVMSFCHFTETHSTQSETVNQSPETHHLPPRGEGHSTNECCRIMKYSLTNNRCSPRNWTLSLAESYFNIARTIFWCCDTVLALALHSRWQKGLSGLGCFATMWLLFLCPTGAPHCLCAQCYPSHMCVATLLHSKSKNTQVQPVTFFKKIKAPLFSPKAPQTQSNTTVVVFSSVMDH